MQIEAFFDPRTSTMTYVVYDAATKDAVVIDPVLDYEPQSSRTWTESVEKVAAFLREHALTLHCILETHAHADHLSGSQWLKRAFSGSKLAVGARITEVQALFRDVFELPKDFPVDGSQFDVLLADNQQLTAGSLVIRTIYTPGHTPACVCYLIDNALFTGDTLFMPDQGTGRCDFPGGSAASMYQSVTQRIYSLPDSTRIFVGHDYQPGGRPLRYESTVEQQKRANVQLRADMSAEEFIKARQARDHQLEAPRLLFQSVQVNIDAGRLPSPAPNQVRYLKIPINVFRPEGDGDVELRKI